ncbi:MAG: hypothetical protein LBM56_00990 [Burkholderiaceae bacterium]|jgi:hypothetical protein|nr:hypothetical protein [Burkholderiaceae bacterium]
MKTFCQYVALMALMAFCCLSHAEDSYQKATCQLNPHPSLKIPDDIKGKSVSIEVKGKGAEACSEAKEQARETLKAKIPDEYRMAVICSKTCQAIRY